MSITGISSTTAMRIARYQAEALQSVDRSAARIAADRRFTSFAEDSVSATREVAMRAQQSAAGLHLRATQDAAAAAEAASEGLRSASDILTELRNAVLALDAGDPSSVTAVQQTVTQLTTELTRIGQSTTTVGGKSLLDGSIASTPLSFTVGSSGSASDQVELTAISLKADDLGSSSLKLDEIDFTALSPTAQADALAAIDEARTAVTDSLTSTAAVSSAMGYHATAVGVRAGALDTALTNLVGVDLAEESLNMARNSLRAEVAAVMLAQVHALQLSMVRQLLTIR
jgi:flagellin-like hook-associated protein FlgL